MTPEEIVKELDEKIEERIAKQWRAEHRDEINGFRLEQFKEAAWERLLDHLVDVASGGQ